MGILSVRFEDEEYEALSNFAKAKRVSMNKALKDAFFEKLEDEYDLKLFDKAYAEYLKNKKAYTTEEVCKELKIDLWNIRLFIQKMPSENLKKWTIQLLGWYCPGWRKILMIVKIHIFMEKH